MRRAIEIIEARASRESGCSTGILSFLPRKKKTSRSLPPETDEGYPVGYTTRYSTNSGDYRVCSGPRYIRTHARTHICTHACTRTCTHACTRAHAHARMYADIPPLFRTFVLQFRRGSINKRICFWLLYEPAFAFFIDVPRILCTTEIAFDAGLAGRSNVLDFSLKIGATVVETQRC